jgi:hypothetical protein
MRSTIANPNFRITELGNNRDNSTLHHTSISVPYLTSTSWMTTTSLAASITAAPSASRCWTRDELKGTGVPGVRFREDSMRTRGRGCRTS